MTCNQTWKLWRGWLSASLVVFCMACSVESSPPPSSTTTGVCVLYELMLQVWNFPLPAQCLVAMTCNFLAGMLRMEYQFRFHTAAFPAASMLNTADIAWAVLCIAAYLAPKRVCSIVCSGPPITLSLLWCRLSRIQFLLVESIYLVTEMYIVGLSPCS